MDFQHEPFRYQPAEDPDAVISGPAYTRTYRWAAAAITLLCSVWFARLFWQDRIQIDTAAGRLYVGGALLILVCMVVFIWRSRTTLSSREITQSWIRPKQFPIRDMAYARLFHWRGLAWLIAPRLYVRTLDGKFASFYIATPEMLREARRLVDALNQWRDQALRR